uniref:Uncharacterized protein n=1 Tax=Arundo donax TaxID=35708 RepID=A0A0A9AXQ3_ARUDO
MYIRSHSVRFYLQANSCIHCHFIFWEINMEMLKGQGSFGHSV